MGRFNSNALQDDYLYEYEVARNHSNETPFFF